jgi:hypothetical protein
MKKATDLANTLLFKAKTAEDRKKALKEAATMVADQATDGAASKVLTAVKDLKKIHGKPVISKPKKAVKKTPVKKSISHASKPKKQQDEKAVNKTVAKNTRAQAPSKVQTAKDN